MNRYLTKTFLHHQWFQRAASLAVEWQPVVSPEAQAADTPLDEQIAAWVQRTGAVICHPGQLGMHKEHYEDSKVLCLTLGLTVLYLQLEDVPDVNRATSQPAGLRGSAADTRSGNIVITDGGTPTVPPLPRR